MIDRWSSRWCFPFTSNHSSPCWLTWWQVGAVSISWRAIRGETLPTLKFTRNRPRKVTETQKELKWSPKHHPISGVNSLLNFGGVFGRNRWNFYLFLVGAWELIPWYRQYGQALIDFAYGIQNNSLLGKRRLDSTKQLRVNRDLAEFSFSKLKSGWNPGLNVLNGSFWTPMLSFRLFLAKFTSRP